MHRRSLAGVVGKVVLSGLDNAGDRGDIDDGAGPAVVQVSALLQQRQERCGGEEELGDVCAEGLLSFIEGTGRMLEELLLELFGIIGFRVGC